MARTSRDPPQEPHYRDEVEGGRPVRNAIFRLVRGMEATCRRTSGCRPTLRSAPSERGRTRRGVGPPRRRVCHDCGPARTLGPGREPRRTDGRCPATALMMDHIFGPAQRPPSRLPCGAASAYRARARAARVSHSAEGGPRGVRPQAVRLGSSAAAAVGCPRAWPAGLGAVAR